MTGAPINKKLVVVGDGACGKTCMLIVHSKGEFPKRYVPTVFENYSTQVVFNRQLVEFSLWDTAGQEDYDRLRPLSYPESSVVLMCFSVDSPTSLENVTEKWYPEVMHFLEKVPKIVVGLKTDLRDEAMARGDQMMIVQEQQQPQEDQVVDAEGNLIPNESGATNSVQRQQFVTYEQGAQVAALLGCKYFECSAKTAKGLDEVFSTALKIAMQSNFSRMRKKACSIL